MKRETLSMSCEKTNCFRFFKKLSGLFCEKFLSEVVPSETLELWWMLWIYLTKETEWFCPSIFFAIWKFITKELFIKNANINVTTKSTKMCIKFYSSNILITKRSFSSCFWRDVASTHWNENKQWQLNTVLSPCHGDHGLLKHDVVFALLKKFQPFSREKVIFM